MGGVDRHRAGDRVGAGGSFGSVVLRDLLGAVGELVAERGGAVPGLREAGRQGGGVGCEISRTVRHLPGSRGELSGSAVDLLHPGD